MKNSFLNSVHLFILFLFIPIATSLAQSISAEQMEQMKFRHIGPVGNRVTSAVGIPGNDMIYYVGAASGGIWKTVDGGLNWKPIFDKQPVHSIGALALAPSDPEIIYAGTGESFIRSNVSIGNGVWKSMDGGMTWNQMGLEKTGRIGRIVVHPKDPNTVYVAALGHAYAPQKERGIFKSTDGGRTWRHVLSVDENTGASEVVMDPSNPRIMFAGMWQLSLKTWNRVSGGPGSGIFKSLDGGETWKKLEGNGLPKGPVGKIAMAMTQANPNRVYALIETGDGVESISGEPESGELWRSDDKGNTWKLISHDRNLGARQPYYTRVEASTDNPNEVYFISYNFYTSIDGGKTTIPLPPGAVARDAQPNWDHHHMWIDPTNGNRMIVAGDGGISVSHNRGKTWLRTQIPVAQLYHVTTDNAVPYNVLTNRQDGPSMRGPSRSRVGSIFGPGFISYGMWHDVGGGESGFATADPSNPDKVWSSASGFGALGGVVSVYNAQTRQYRQVEVWPEVTIGHSADMVKYRFQWTFPLLISPHDNNTVYVTSQFVHRTQNDGQTWEIISPDLTLNDKSKQAKSGGLTPDNIGVEYANVIYAFEESPMKKGLFWAGTNDGQIHISQDDGKTWTNVGKNIKNLPELGTVRNIDASKYEEGKAYVTIDFHEVGNFEPHVYKTSNYGKSWTKITNGIEGGNLSYCRMVKEDPVRKGLLYLGTENKLYISFDDGNNWQVFMGNLPAAPMYWIDIQEHFNDLVLGTYGRGIWILDDISPLQQMSSNPNEAEVTLFQPKDAYRFQPVTQTMEFFKEASAGEDPPPGASINFWVSRELQDTVKIHFTNASGDTVRTMKHKSKPGINRVWWNFRTDPVEPIVMQTPPRHAEWFPMSPSGTRKAPLIIPWNSFMVNPGAYGVHVEANGKTYSSNLNVIKDPNSEGTVADIQQQIELLEKIYSRMNEVSGMINSLEKVRKQLMDLNKWLDDDHELLTDINSVQESLHDFEHKLTQLNVTGTGQDAIRWPSMLFEKFGYLGFAVATSDFKPADQHQEVFEKLDGELKQYKSEMEQLMNGSLKDLEAKLKQNQVDGIIK